VFDRASINRQTEIEISSGAELLALEWLILGRAAHGEEMVGGCIIDSWRVKKDGQLVWADTFRATDDTFSHLHRTALLSDSHAIGMLIYFGPHGDAWLKALCETVPRLSCQCAATSVAGLIILRFAAKEASDLRRVPTKPAAERLRSEHPARSTAEHNRV
jgi:urease accessory protein